MINKKQKKGFSLVELLVVVSIIALLMGLSIGGINYANNYAKQIADTSNVRQVGLALTFAAQENNGVFPTTDRDGNDAGTDSKAIFAGLVADGFLTDPKVLSTKGTVPYADDLDPTSIEFASNNIGFDYFKGFDNTDHPQIPLLFSKNAFSSADNMKAANYDLTTVQDTHPWKAQGVVIGRLGGSAEFVSSRQNQLKKATIDDSVSLTSGTITKAD